MRGSSCQKYKQKQVANKAVVLCCVSVVTIILTFYMKPTYVYYVLFYTCFQILV